MPLAGLVVNRVHETGADGITAVDAESAAQKLVDGAAGVERTTGELLTIHAERMRVSAREARLKRRFSASHPGVSTVSVAALAGDVHDLDGLRRIGDLLAGADDA
jgi:hypothetical protein